MSTDVADLTRSGSDVGGPTDRFVRYLFATCAAVTVLTTVGIVLVLVVGSADFFAEISIVEFLVGTEWSPRAATDPGFGVLPLVWGTLVVTVGAALLAIPVGTLVAIYLSEYADGRVRAVLKPTLEILAGIPTIVYGFFALSFVTPQLQRIFPETGTFNAASGAIVVGIMVLPMVSSLGEDAMSAVPDSLRQAGYGLGATKFEVSTSVVVPSALSGIVSAYILALSRAIGETMIVALAVGNLPQISLDPFEQMQTMTAYMVQIGLSDVSAGSLVYHSLFAVGLTLFVVTLGMNVLSIWIKRRYGEEYQ